MSTSLYFFLSIHMTCIPSSGTSPLPTLKPQEIPFDHYASAYCFEHDFEKPFVATRAALNLYGHATITACLSVLQNLAEVKSGIDYLQVFEDPSKSEPLWFIDDGDNGAVTALLPSDY